MKNNEKQSKCENCELKMLLTCVNYCLNQVRESEAQILDETTGKGYDSVAYLEHQLLSLNGLKKDLEEAIEDCHRAEAAMEALDELFEGLFKAMGRRDN